MALIDLTSHVVPEDRRGLPIIEQPGNRAVRQHPRVVATVEMIQNEPGAGARKIITEARERAP